MSKYKYTEFERQINSVLSHQSAELSEIHFPSTDRIIACISSSEELLQKLGYKVETPQKDLPHLVFFYCKSKKEHPTGRTRGAFLFYI